MTFEDLGLTEKVLSAVKDAGYDAPTPIQAGAIPAVLAGRDVLGLAQTGTGKTAAFTMPILCRLETGRARARMPRTLILEPTRELAAQVADSIRKYGVNHKISMALLIGGVSFDEQDKLLTRGVDVLIATPGRLIDHFERGRVLLSGIEVFVIDEADRMLDMGFIPDIERICGLLPPRRQTLFFSATMPPEIDRLVHKFLNAPERVEVSPPSTTAATVEQRIAPGGAGDPKSKRAALRREIDASENLKNAIVFCNRKRDVDIVFRSLKRHGYSVGALHGDMDQRARMAMLDDFRDGNVPLLVASDVAARGLDIPEVSHVFNYDVPSHAEDYVHRIGRTGRAGRTGHTIMLVTPSDAKWLAAIEKLTGQTFDKTALESDAETGDGAAADTKEVPAKSPARNRRSKRGRRDDSREAREDRQPGDNRRAETGERAPRDRKTPPKQVAFRDTDYVPAFLLRPARVKEET